jgi:flagellar L-ring protein precursor FlgH
MKRIGMTVICMLTALTLSACGGGRALKGSSTLAPAVVPPGAKRVTQAPPVDALQTGADAGLFRDDEYRGFFQDLRAHNVGDLVTINIVETSKASKAAATKTARTSSIDAGITNFLGFEKQLHMPKAFDNANMFNASMTNNFDGSGATSRDESMTASVTAMVTRVLPNGNLFIEGTRRIRVNNEIQHIVLSGIVRPSDISPDNTVLSSYIADARIDYTGNGPVSDKQRPGWLARLLDVVWPF